MPLRRTKPVALSLACRERRSSQALSIPSSPSARSPRRLFAPLQRHVMVKLLPEERQGVAQYIHSICAITLDQSKDYLIESRLSAVMEETRCTSFAQLVSRSKSDLHGVLKRRIIDEI